MFKKLIYILLLGVVGYMIFVPIAAEQNRKTFEEAGVTNVSSFDSFGSD